MKNKHDHTVCEHEIVFCKPCNEVYCEKCDDTWEHKYDRITLTANDSTATGTHFGHGNDIHALSMS